MSLCSRSRAYSARSRCRCLGSMTKITSAQRMSAGPTDLRALGLVPAERTLKPDRRRHIVSAVGLRHWLRLQMNRRLVTGDPERREWFEEYVTRASSESTCMLSQKNLYRIIGRLSSLFAVATLFLMLGAIFFVLPMQPFVLLLFFPRRQTGVETTSPPLPVAPLKMGPGVSVPRFIS